MKRAAIPIVKPFKAKAMFLYIWITKYNNLQNIGINLSSAYDFDFKPDEDGGIQVD